MLSKVGRENVCIKLPLYPSTGKCLTLIRQKMIHFLLQRGSENSSVRKHYIYTLVFIYYHFLCS